MVTKLLLPLISIPVIVKIHQSDGLVYLVKRKFKTQPKTSYTYTSSRKSLHSMLFLQKPVAAQEGKTHQYEGKSNSSSLPF